MLEAKRRNQVTEECDTVPGCYEFSASGTCREARVRAEGGKTGHPSSTTAGFFSHWSASEPCRGSCRGMYNLHYTPCVATILNWIHYQFIICQAKAGHWNSLLLSNNLSACILLRWTYCIHLWICYFIELLSKSESFFSAYIEKICHYYLLESQVVGYVLFFQLFILLLHDRSRLISTQLRQDSKVMEVLQEHHHHMPGKMLQTLG